MTYEKILSRFSIKRRRGDSAQALCPCHSDREASLTITKSGGRTLIHCHAGCSTDSILEAVGLKAADLFDGEGHDDGSRWRRYVESRERRKVEGVYQYTDFSGKNLYTKLRLSGKRFVFGRLDGDRFLYGLGGQVRKELPGLYGDVMGVQEAVKAGKTVFYCEGERDADTLRKHGYPAITAGAAGDWHKGLASIFAGADVVICRDNDAAGLKLANAVAGDISGIAKHVRIVNPMPDVEKADITDFFAAGHTDEEFIAILEQAGEVKQESEQWEESDALDLSHFHLIGANGQVTCSKGYWSLRGYRYRKNLIKPQFLKKAGLVKTVHLPMPEPDKTCLF